MKNLFQLLFILLILSACGGGGQQAAETTAEETTEETAEAEVVVEEPVEVKAVCIWENLSVREEPKKKGKWKTSLSKGEKITTTGETMADAEDDGREYVKVILADGETGWSLKDLVASDAYPAAALKETTIYKRPDILTKSDKSFKQFDIVAVKSVNDKFAEVVGKRRDGKWIDKGYVMIDNLTDNDVDLAVAKFTDQAIAAEEDSVKRAKLDEILNNEMFQDSRFFVAVEELYESTL